MNLEDQVCSLDLAKRLKELDVKQESCFYWASLDEKDWKIFNTFQPTGFSAFTVAELGEILMPGLAPHHGLTIWAHGNPIRWSVQYRNLLDDEGDGIPVNPFVDTLANALAKMLIYLLENKLVKP